MMDHELAKMNIPFGTQESFCGLFLFACSADVASGVVLDSDLARFGQLIEHLAGELNTSVAGGGKRGAGAGAGPREADGGGRSWSGAKRG